MGKGGICFDLNIWSCASESLTRSQLLNKHGEGMLQDRDGLPTGGRRSPGNVTLHWTANAFCSGFVQHERVRDESAARD